MADIFKKIRVAATKENLETVTAFLDEILRVAFDEAGRELTMVLIDSGIPYDPLAKKDPDVTLSAEKRKIGGLGIYLVKKTMDSMTYERRDGRNIVTMKKKFG